MSVLGRSWPVRWGADAEFPFLTASGDGARKSSSQMAVGLVS